MHVFILIVALFIALAVALTISEAHKPPPMATGDNSLNAGVLTLGIAICVAVVAVIVFGWGT